MNARGRSRNGDDLVPAVLYLRMSDDDQEGSIERAAGLRPTGLRRSEPRGGGMVCRETRQRLNDSGL
jgi:hypothetical protein